jgi:fructose-1,6-bisphosphatase/inositol monophosphatase family enzyme
MNSTELDRARKLICRMHDCIRNSLIKARRREPNTLSRIDAVTAADTIYHVDRISEAAIFKWLEQYWPRQWPLELVMEGLEDGVMHSFPKGTPVSRTVFKCIIDPIDGTRNYMVDKRSAWILTGLAPQKGEGTGICDIVVAVMTELPTSKQWRSDQLSAVRSGPLYTSGTDVKTGIKRKINLKPSSAVDYKHGFASFVHFFPEGKALLAQMEEKLWNEVQGVGQGRSPLVFDDQYISTGGQLYELIAGHDRMIADLRPLAFKRLGLKNELVCHPYDICSSLLLQAAGGIVESPLGKGLDIPLDTISPVSWVGYANPRLARLVRPILKRLCHEELGV